MDDVVLNAGHWPDAPGQVVLDDASANGELQVGSTLDRHRAGGCPLR